MGLPVRVRRIGTGSRSWRRVLVVGGFVWTMGLLLCACGDGEGPSGEPGPGECPERCEVLCDRQEACEAQGDSFDFSVEQCREGCALIGDTDWGVSVSMAPLACADADDCDDYRLCLLLGGEADYSCNAIDPDTDDLDDYEASCTGVCSRMLACDYIAPLDVPSCQEQCAQDLLYGWVPEISLDCVQAVSCDRFSTCLQTMYNRGWDEDGDINIDPPDGGDVGEPNEAAPEPVPDNPAD